MKIIVVFSAILLLTICRLHFQETKESYQKFRNHFNKPYLDPYSQQFQKRFQAFCKTVRLVQMQTSGSSQVFDYTPRADFLQDEGVMTDFLYPQGKGQTIQIDDSPKRSSWSNLFKVGAGTPKNWRDQGKISPVKDQGSCGSCWAFTTIAMYEAFLIIKQKGVYDLSEQFLIQCTSLLANSSRNSSCIGGYVDDSGKLTQLNGAKNQSLYPYVSKTYGSRAGSQSTPGICTNVSSQFVFYDNLPDVKNTTFFKRYNNITGAQIQQLLEEGPVGALMYAPITELSAYRSGVFSVCGTFADSYSRINHAVLIVGMDANGNYIIKNSWGSAWGDSGFATISGTNDCALTAFVYAYSWGYQFIGSTLILLLGLLLMFV